jgi:murein DD-endopeptidase MepM/ murein hydrolase activator NlpD
VFSVSRNYSKFRNRRKGLTFLRLFILICIFCSCWYIAQRFLSKEISSPVQNASLVPSIDHDWQKHVEEMLAKPISYYIQRNITGTVVQSGDSFSSLLLSMNVSGKRSEEISRLISTIGVKTIYPGDSVEIKKGVAGNIERFSILSRSYWYSIYWKDSVIQVEKKPQEVTTYTCIINGIITSSLSEQMYECGVSDVITGKFADIFAWDINFFTDPRKGDTFQIVFEQKYADGKKAGYGDILAARYTTGKKTFYAFGFRDTSDKVIHYYDENGKAVQKEFLKAPLRFSRISSGFTYNRRHPVLGIVRPHLGIDYAAPTGTPVAAAADGKVIFAGWKGGYGNYIELSHGGAYVTTYGHLSRILVRNGARVSQSETIGLVGSTGLSTGAHLDYRMRRGSAYVNPNTISLPSRDSIELSRKPAFEMVKVSGLIAMNTRFTDMLGMQVLHINADESTDVVVKEIALNHRGVQ